MDQEAAKPAPAPIPGLAMGCIVHYVLPAHFDYYAHSIRPAIIVRVWDQVQGTCNLQVFVDGPNDGLTERPGETLWKTSILYDPAGAPNTWHWPERL